MQLVPRQDYTSSVPLSERQYIAHIQVFVPVGIPDELTAIANSQEILGFDRGRKKPAAASNGAEIRHDPARDVAQRKADYQRVRAKKKGSNRRHKAQAEGALPKAVAVESLRLPNMLASAAGTQEHPGVNVSAKRALNRAIVEAGMGETNRIILREWNGWEFQSCPYRRPAPHKRARAAGTATQRTARAKRFSSANGATSPTTRISPPAGLCGTGPTRSTLTVMQPLNKHLRGGRSSRPRGTDNFLCSVSKAKPSQSVARRRSPTMGARVPDRGRYRVFTVGHGE